MDGVQKATGAIHLRGESPRFEFPSFSNLQFAMSSRRSSISNGTKQEVITWIDTQGEGVPTRAVAPFRQQGLNLDSGTVRKWWRKRTEILAAPPHLMRVEGGGRSRALGTLEDVLLDAIIDLG
ncbi:unnamed protein product [Phytophthora lilii]|uniref:Unnamed protein product n=1 Tax=Phytophthora lilii TaxID=2077276 RepID=A0A9W7CQ00_9STRA|nr:unnamed protein product [Phytophthora lilii]